MSREKNPKKYYKIFLPSLVVKKHSIIWIVLLPCLQVRGHHVAKLDPLGISCVNFDDSPVTVGFHQVGEKLLRSVVSVLSVIA